MTKANSPMHALFQEANIPLEAVILTIGGMALLIAGIVLFPVSRGSLPYYENGLYGLLLIVFALQIITLGKTPFGDLRRSKLLLAAGIALACVGMATCFLPIAHPLPRLLLIVCFGPGSLLLLLQMCLASDKLRAWLQYGGIFRRLAFGCFLVYGLAVLVAALIWKQQLLPLPVTAAVLLLFGASTLFLAHTLQKIYLAYPEAEKQPEGEVQLSAEQDLLLLMGIFMLLLGGLLIPVNLGLLPFSGSAQLGLLMVIFAVQMLASGSTPIGAFRRSRLMILLGLVFAALGIVSCLIPDLLVATLTVLVGVLNILGGISGLVKTGIPLLKKPAGPAKQAPPILTKLFTVQVTLNLLAMAFGTSMLIPNLVPGMLIGLILAANGGVLLYLLRILVVLDKMRRAAAGSE
ncbi:MAG: hypothetical protein PHG54_09140 [Smithellaceae bacterium]|nr:hypothetical protein [Smithellaceae bacterium]